MKNMLLRFLMQHYSKYKTTMEGACLLIDNDVTNYEVKVLRYRLDAQPRDEGDRATTLNVED